MSRIKDYIHSRTWVSDVEFMCPLCQHHNNQRLPVPEPNYWADKSRDMYSEGEIEILCQGCQSYFNGDVRASPYDCFITFQDHNDTEVRCGQPIFGSPPDEWLTQWEIPDHPKSVFDSNSSELRKIINTQASIDGKSLINRMIFAQVLTFLEAYFCDNLIKGLREHPDLLAEFSEKDRAINKANIRPSDVLRDPDVVKNWIEHNLKDRIYHKFEIGDKRDSVPLWYEQAFGFLLTPNKNDLKKLHEYVILRHDCVHRNGETKDGKKHNIFDKNYLVEALNTADSIVAHIDKKMQELPTLESKP